MHCHSDTFGGPAPAHIEDFWSGPNQLGTRQILPEFRRFVADVFDSEYTFRSLPCPKLLTHNRAQSRQMQFVQSRLFLSSHQIQRFLQLSPLSKWFSSMEFDSL